MSASVGIVTATSGETLIVSVAAVQYDGDDAYLWLAGDERAAWRHPFRRRARHRFSYQGRRDHGHVRRLLHRRHGRRTRGGQPDLGARADHERVLSDDEETQVSFSAFGTQPASAAA